MKSAGLVSSATALSRVFGLIREQVMAYYFGASLATDAFVVAFRVPNLLRDMFAEGALSSAFVPVFKEKLVKESDAEAFKLADAVITGILVVVGLIVLLGIVATPAIIYISAKGFTADPFKFDLTVNLTRLMFVYLLLVSLSAAVMGMLNSFGRFGIPAISPACFNIGVIASVLALHRYLGLPVYALAIGVLVGGVGQVLVQLPSLWRIGYRFKPRVAFLDEGFKKVVRLFMPMIVGMSAGRINILVNTLLASFLIEGSISYLNYSYRLMHFPLGVFAVALGTVALPSASEKAARGDMEGLARTFREAISLNMLLIVPSAVVLAVWGHEIVTLIYKWGEFSEVHADNTTLALLHYSYGLIGFAAVRVTVPVFYALGDSKLPMKISIATVFLNMFLYFPMISLLDFAGLSSATSLAALVNFGLLLYFMPKKGVPVSYRGLALNFLRIVLAALLAVIGVRFLPYDFSAGQSEVVGRMLDLLVPVVAGLLMYLGLCYVFRVKEIALVSRALFRGKRTG
jgi:putative peptidoglycan lipid II flippase